MRRSILAIGLACLLSFTSFTSFTAPVSAADLTMPVKAPPPPEAAPVEFCYACLLILVPIGLCIAFCNRNHENLPLSAGAPDPHST
jgi:hypothetical protein